MPKAEHTPGPLKVRHVTAFERPAKVREHFAISPQSGPTLAYLPEGRADIQEANAQLFAAAPDMLEALKEVQGFFDSCGFPVVAKKAAAMTQAAIAKAEAKS